MSGRRPLKGGAPRLLSNHNLVAGRWYRECWDALDAELGPFTGLLRLEAGRVCVAWTQFRAATLALEAIKASRAHGRGRRPNDRQVERAARRQGLADGSYSQALERLRAQAGRRGRGAEASVDALLAQVDRAAREEAGRDGD